MRIISLLVVFCFSFNVMASTGTIQELERHMDDYTYALSVEWDQKDQHFYDAQTKVFFEKLEVLIENGLTKDEIIKMVESKSKNKAALEAIKLKLSLLTANVSSEELVKIVKDSAKDLYAQGASWNGEVIIGVALSIVLVAALAYAFLNDSKYECVAWEEQYVCNKYENCQYTNSGNTGYHYDMWGNWVAPGYTCYGIPQTICGNQNVCIEQVKKD